MFALRLLLVGLACGWLTHAGPLGADDPNPETDDELRAGYVEVIVAAHDLAAFAAKHKAPEAYITAAGLLLKVEAQTHGKMGELPKDVSVLDANDKETKEELKGGAKLSEQAKAWFDDARALAAATRTTKEVEALIKLAEKRQYLDPEDQDTKTRGKAGGPANLTRKISAGDTQVFRWKFKGNQVAAVGMTSGSKLGIKIVGPNGGTLFTLAGQRAVYRFQPKQDGVYVVRVHNGTKGPTTFNLASN